ncbi:MAG TPA: hypothetical protein VMM56_02655 [Planctomycetaceae bacterium]|nr:hypothetical protein [Planctomycetaceae bacterium]
MFDLVFTIFPLIFAAMFIFTIVMIFRQFGRVRQIQDRVFDTIDRQLERGDADGTAAQDRTPRDYHCDQCGARLEDGGDVSPSGDFKCSYCGKWSNIHSRSR